MAVHRVTAWRLAPGSCFCPYQRAHQSTHRSGRVMPSPSQRDTEAGRGPPPRLCPRASGLVLGASEAVLPVTRLRALQGLKNQTQVKLNIVSCPPVTTVLIKRPDLKYQLGFSVQNGIVSLLLCPWPPPLWGPGAGSWGAGPTLAPCRPGREGGPVSPALGPLVPVMAALCRHPLGGRHGTPVSLRSVAASDSLCSTNRYPRI